MRRSAVLLVTALLGLVAQPAGAEPPLLEDPRGDAPVAVGDIVSVDITTVLRGTGRVVITMTLASPPSTSTPYSYRVRLTAGSCDFQAVYFAHPTAAAFPTSAMGCDDHDNATPLGDGNGTVSGSTITWKLPLSGAFRRGAVLTDIRAGTEPGGLSTGTRLEAAGDTAATSTTYRIGS